MVPLSDALNQIKKNNKVAIVGLSPKPDRPVNKVGAFLKGKGFDVTPVNPKHTEILGRTALSDLKDLQKGDVDWIDLFVNPNKLMEMADEIVRLSPKLVWCQIGVVNEEFNQKMDDANIPYIADVCPKKEWVN